MSENLNTDAIFAMDNPDLDWGGAETAQPATEAVTEPAQATAVPEQTEQAHPEAAQPDPQENAFKAIREAERARAQAEADRAYQAGVQAAYQQLAQQQQQTQSAEEAPDPVIDPAGYAQWMRAEIVRELAPQIQQSSHRAAEVAYQQNLHMARALEPRFNEYLQAANELAAKYPSLVADIQNSDNPGLRIIEVGKMALSAKSGSGEITDEVRQKVLAEEAAKRAANGQLPNVTLPRGVGNTPSGAGMDESLPPPSEWGRIAAADPARWEKIKHQALGSNQGVL